MEEDIDTENLKKPLLLGAFIIYLGSINQAMSEV